VSVCQCVSVLVSVFMFVSVSFISTVLAHHVGISYARDTYLGVCYVSKCAVENLPCSK